MTGITRQRALASAAAALALWGCGQAAGSTGAGNTASTAKPAIKIGSTNFGEQLIVAELYAQVLEANGYKIERKLNLGNREIVAPALESGQIDMYAEYLATYVTFLTKDTSKASSDPAATAKNLQEALKAKNITLLDFAPAVDVNGFCVLKATADKYKLTKLSDLAAVAGQLVLGAAAECPTRPFCIPGLEKTYNIKFKDFKPLDSGGPLTVAALEAGQIDVALLYSTDAVISAKGFILLQDDKHLQLADNIAPVVRTEIVNKAPADFKTLINGISAKLTTEEMTAMNKKAGVDKQDPKDVAAQWLKSKSLIK